MAQKNYTKHQQNIIRNYYDNRETIMLQKLSEMVTELYLAETPAASQKLWDRVAKCMLQLQIPPRIADHILAKRDVAVLAKNLNDWMAKKPT